MKIINDSKKCCPSQNKMNFCTFIWIPVGQLLVTYTRLWPRTELWSDINITQSKKPLPQIKESQIQKLFLLLKLLQFFKHIHDQ